MQTITITVDGDGGAKVEVDGVPGPKCKDATKQLERALGVVAESKLTADYHKREVGRVKL